MVESSSPGVPSKASDANRGKCILQLMNPVVQVRKSECGAYHFVGDRSDFGGSHCCRHSDRIGQIVSDTAVNPNLKPVAKPAVAPDHRESMTCLRHQPFVFPLTLDLQSSSCAHGKPLQIALRP